MAMNEDPLIPPDVQQEQIEDKTGTLRHEAKEKLKEARAKLHQAKMELENTAMDVVSPKRNPFGRTTANLKHHAEELQAAPAPVFPKSPQRPVRQLSSESPQQETYLDGSE
jgi:hypothetical protein